MDILLFSVVVASAASVGVAVVALFLAIRHARHEHDANVLNTAFVASGLSRRGGNYSIEDTVPWMQSRQPEWDSR